MSKASHSKRERRLAPPPKQLSSSPLARPWLVAATAGVAVLAVVAAAAAALMMRGSDSSAKSVAETAPAVHPFLSVFVGGDQVEVPTDIGISYSEGAMAALHTHDSAGTIHVESPVVRDYNLGQFFDVWGVRLTKRCLGGYCAGKGKQLRAFVDGKPVGGSPRTVKLVDGERVVVAFGTPSQIRKTRS